MTDRLQISLGFVLFDSSLEGSSRPVPELNSLHFISNFEEFSDKLTTALEKDQSSLAGALEFVCHKDGIL